MLNKHSCEICGLHFENYFPHQKTCSYSCRSKLIAKTWEARFWKFVKKGKGCWIWTGARSQNGNGYGVFVRTNHRTPSHRVSWELENGEIPEGIQVLHKCDNPACVRPSHLFLGTQSDNMRDCLKKGRLHLASLSNEDAARIHAMISQKKTISEISEEFRITKSHVRKIRSGKCWAHIKI